MSILLNGQDYQLAKGTSLGALVRLLGLEGKRVAAELNGAVVPRSRHGATLLREGDRLEIIKAVGGG